MRHTDEKKSIELGELYRELRIARGLKLKDIATDSLSISQLSKFENGQSMLSADRLLMAIEGIHMTFAEFGHAVNDYQNPEFLQLVDKVIELDGKQDSEGLKNLVKEYGTYETYDVYNRLNLLVIKDSIYSLDNSYEVEDEEIEFLTRYLYDIEEWTEYELLIFGNTVTLLSDQDLVFLSKAFVERDKLYRSLSSNKINAKMVLLNIISVMIERNQLYYVGYFIDKLKSLLDIPHDLFFIASLNFFALLMDCLQDGRKNSQKLEDYISAMKVIGNDDLVSFFQAKLNQYRQ